LRIVSGITNGLPHSERIHRSRNIVHPHNTAASAPPRLPASRSSSARPVTSPTTRLRDKPIKTG